MRYTFYVLAVAAPLIFASAYVTAEGSCTGVFPGAPELNKVQQDKNRKKPVPIFRHGTVRTV